VNEILTAHQPPDIECWQIALPKARWCCIHQGCFPIGGKIVAYQVDGPPPHGQEAALCPMPALDALTCRHSLSRGNSAAIGFPVFLAGIKG
jgi:hypothetical protein